MSELDRETRRRYTRCSFCGMGQDRVRKLVAGPGVYICDKCIYLCVKVLEEDAGHAGEWRATAGPLPGRRRRASLPRWLRNVFRIRVAPGLT